MKKLKVCLLILVAGAIAICILFLMHRKPAVVAPTQNQPLAAPSNTVSGLQPTNVIAGTAVAPQPANGFQQAQAHAEQVKQRQDQDVSL